MLTHTRSLSFRTGLPLALSLGMLVFAFVPLAAIASPTPPAIYINSVSDVSNHSYTTPVTFSCDENPLTGEVTISGSGNGVAPPGLIEQYGVALDWGDGHTDSGLGTFTPPSGHAGFSFTFSGSHTYASTGSDSVVATLYHQDDSGNDNQASTTISLTTCSPAPSIGTIEIQKYSCPAETVVTRSENGVDKAVPEGCVAQEGATFGYVHGDQTDANSPYPELSASLTDGGSTNGSGTLDISGLPANGRYLVEETDGNGQKLANDAVLGLYCEGDGDTSGTNDNQELTFVPADGTTHCVAYDPAPPAPPQVPSCSIVSDSSTQTDGHDSVVLSFIHSAWTHLLDASGAKWIWGEQGPTDPTVDATEVFTKVVHISGTPASAFIDLAADNGYQVKVNGNIIANQLASEFNYGATTTIAIPLGDLTANADNTFEITVKNFAMAGGTLQTNPAGLDYDIVINDATCSAPQPPPAPTCNPDAELLANPSFENPVVSQGANWDVFPSGTSGLSWIVSWLGAAVSGRPDIANLELQKGVNGWSASDGSQWAELDTDWNGPSGPNGSPSSVAISQEITTIPGDTYTFSFDFSPRPGTSAAENKVEALAGGIVIGSAGPTDGSALLNTAWERQSFSFTATTTATRVTLRDAGTPSDSLGTFVDNASLRCSVPEKPKPEATVVATKVVCDNESDLPNWGAGGHGPITATTAADWVESHPGCHLQSGWEFQWGDQNAGDSGDTATSTFPGYTTFGPTDAAGAATTTVPLDSLSEIHLREVLQDGYIPFTHAAHPDNSDDVSAEFYCSNDVLNYDNWDFIRSPQANTTYYCVGFNAPVRPLTSTVTMCKADESEHPLSGWQLSLTSAHVGDISVKPDGNEYALSNVPAGSYVFTASGQYVYRPNDVAASTSDAVYSLRLPSDGVYGGPYAPWVRENNFPMPNTGWLGIIYNDAFTDWGSVFSGLHTYALGTTTAATSSLDFKILDDQYADNAGALDVSVDKGYIGTTDETGCVTFDNVPYGDYTAGEVPQQGWTEVSGAGPVTIDEPEQSIVIVNRQGGEEGGGSLKVHILKYLDNGDGGIAQIPDDSGAPSFPMHASWNSTNLGSGAGDYVLGDAHGGASFKYAADTSAMDAPADYATNEVTGEGSVVVANEDSCAPGKYVLEGYQTGDTLDEAENAELATSSPSFTGLTADKYVIVVNKVCGDDNGGGGEPSGPTETFSTTTIRAADLAQTDSDALAGKWFFWDDNSDNRINSLGSFVDGPSSAPLNDGSAQISATAGQKIALATGAFAGTSLADITSLQYSTYRSEGTSALALALQFDINTNGTTAPTPYQGRLVYEPYLSGAAVADNAWQTWNPMSGTGWWFSHAGSDVASSCTQATPCTWAQIVAAFPNMGISGGTFFKAGQWSADFTGNVDKFVITVNDGSNATTTIYDFEPTDDGNPPGSGDPDPHPQFGSIISNFSAPQGQVLGASSSTPDSCGPLLTQFLRQGSSKNLVDQVLKLQQFLKNLGFITFDPTGFFGPLTTDGVKAFQEQYASTVLTPWGIKGPTGLVYLTTRRMINLLYCPTLDIPVPTPLIQWSDGAQG